MSDNEPYEQQGKRHKLRPVVKKMLRYEDENFLIQKHLAYAIGHLAPAMKLSRDVLQKRIEANPKSMWFLIERNMDQEMFDRVQAVIDENKIQGFSLEKTSRRRYVEPELASHVVGYTCLLYSSDAADDLTRVAPRGARADQ